jgi:hypothetical protein
MIRGLGRLLKWAVVALLLLVVALAAPIGYVEFACHAPVTNGSYRPLITDPAFQRQEANTYLTYPEWHIVYAYDGLAEVLKSSDEYDFDYGASVFRFWSATCSLTRLADAHGGADGATRLMIYTIGASFSLEMGLKAAYEETVGRVFAALRGPVKTPQDEVAAAMAVDYAAFLRQTPWYRYDFSRQVYALWDAPVINALRGWERRLALGAEWSAKIGYARAIAAGVAATGEAQLEIHSVVAGLTPEALAKIADVRVISSLPDGVVILTPRYARFTEILAEIVSAGGEIREIAGNDDIMVSLSVPPAMDYVGPGEVIVRMPRDGFAADRVLVDTKVSELARLFKAWPLGDPGLEHVFDY